jgi:hypothetical protein
MKISELLTESAGRCPKCGGPAFSDLILAEKKDACYHKVKASAKVWPSAYASGRLVQCRKKGAANYGNKSKNEDEQLDELTFLGSECTKDCSGHRAGYEWSSRRGNVPGNSPYSPSFNKGANLRAAGK